MLSAICLNLKQSKILLFGNELKQYETKYGKTAAGLS